MVRFLGLLFENEEIQCVSGPFTDIGSRIQVWAVGLKLSRMLIFCHVWETETAKLGDNCVGPGQSTDTDSWNPMQPCIC